MYVCIYIYIIHIHIYIYIYISYIYRPVAKRGGGGGRTPPCPTKIISIRPKLKSMSFDAMPLTRDLKNSSFYHFYIERQYRNITFSFRKWHNYQPKDLNN